MVDYKKEYKIWLEKADKSLQEELISMANDETKIEDSFYRNLAFGTGGLRGVIGAGSNRMNIHVVAKASQGLANYVKSKFEKGSIAISYDSRINSDVFAKVASEVFVANGLKVYIYNELMPTPCLSYAVRYLHCSAGIMITASHNPAKYNGYKVYGADGCQITTEAASEILSEIEKLNTFEDVLKVSYEQAINQGQIEIISSEVYTSFCEQVKAQSVLYGDKIIKDVAIVYSPLNGTGLKPVLRVLKENGFTNISVVPEQEEPDGNFPTCPYPNPEIREAMELGIKFAKHKNADLLMATDPDCDRVGIAVKDNDDYVLLSGNQVGLLLLDYICSQRLKHNKMPKESVMIKTIVTMDLAEKIADYYDVKTINVLTGFKFIGEQIGKLEKQGKADSYILGFEESYGYLTGQYVRDKDAVNGAYMICEMFAYYKTQGVTLIQKLNDIYDRFGYCLNTLYSYEFEGSLGMEKMKNIMSSFRAKIKSIGKFKVNDCLDYSLGIEGLPKSDVLKFKFDIGSVVIRPSGTEPKLKAYISILESSVENAKLIEKELVKSLNKLILS